MDIFKLKDFFLWCTLINFVFLTFTAIVLTFAADWVYKMHSRWYHFSRDSFNVIIYCFLGFYKILFIVFNFVPLVALLIICS